MVVVQRIPEIDPACVFTVERAGFVTKKRRIGRKTGPRCRLDALRWTV
jgi:hypothetical protein